MSGNTVNIRATLDGAQQVGAGLKGIKAEAQGLGSGFAGVGASAEKGLAKMGGALGHAEGQVMGLTNALGPLVGVAGLAGLTTFLGSSVKEAADFGANVQKVAKTTNLATGEASAMVDTLDKWGVSGERQITMIGKLEKNVGTLAATTKKADEFQKRYGLSLVDSNGHVADANTLLLRAADFNSLATATDKATVLSKMYGKTWQDMIPILSKGSGFIKEQERTAIHLTDTQLANITKFRSAQREFADTFGDLQVKIGSELMPMITSGLKDVGAWLDTHSDDVVKFFHDAVDFGGKLASGAKLAFGAIKTGWDAIPDPLKQLLVTGFAAGKVTKFMFGFGPMDIAKGLLPSLGGIFKRGSSPANPMYVTGAMGGGVPGAGGMGLVSKMFLVGEAIGLAALVLDVRQGIADGNTKLSEDIKVQTDKYLAQNPNKDALLNSLAAVNKGIDDIQANPLNVFVQGDALDNLKSMRDAIEKQLNTLTNPVAHPGGVDSPRTVAANSAVIDAIMKRAEAKGLHPTVLAAENTNQRNQLRAAAVQKAAADKQASAAAIMFRAAERLSWTGGGGLSSVQNTQNRREHASGMLGLTSGRTDLGYAGEAGNEAVAIIRNPRPIRGGGGMHLNVTVQLVHNGVITPGVARQFGETIGPIITSWMQRNGVMPRVGSPLRG